MLKDEPERVTLRPLQ